MKFYSTLFLLIFSLVIIPELLISQTYNIKKFNVEDGLAQSQVVSLFQDKLGNLWIGTNGGGVSIYNGKEFKTLTKDDGLANNVVYSITEDDKGNKYFGTNEGLSVFNGWTFKNFDEKSGLPNNRIFKILNDNHGKIFIGTGRGVVIYKDNKFELFINDSLFNSSTIFTIYIHDNIIYFGTLNQGLFVYNNGKLSNYTIDDGLSNNNIRSLLFDDNKLWICTDKGINTLSNGQLSQTTIGGGIVGIIKSNTVDQMLFAALGGYISNKSSIISKSDENSFNQRLTDDKTKFWTFIEDNEQNVWIGTLDGSGLIKFPKRTFINFNITTDSLLSNNVYSILEYPNDTFQVGFLTLGITIFNFKHKFRKIKELGYDYFLGQSVNSIINDSDNIWFSTNESIVNLNVKTDEYKVYVTQKKYKKFKSTDLTPYSKTQLAKFNKRGKHLVIVDNIDELSANTILKDSKNIIWFGSIKGVFKFDNGLFIDFNKTFPELKDKVIFKIFEDSNRNLWFTSNSGVFYFDGKKLNHIGEKEGFTDETVVSVIQDKRGNYWFGTKQGLFRYDENFFIKINKDKTDLINKEKGLSSNNIYSLLLDNNDNLFIGSDKGIDKFNIKLYNTSRKIDITNYGQLEGFMGQECNINACYKDHKGRLWFGTVGGATVYDPRFDIKNTVKPITQINSLHLAYKEFDWSPYSNGVDSLTKLPKELVLPYNKNHLTFEFVAASLAIPEKVKYQYLLEGLNTEWSPPRTKSEADFPSLPDGDYIFKVKACNNDGVWNEIPTEFHFTIKPPFWKTWWFYTILTILTLILFFLYVKWREAKLKQDKAILEQTVLERTEEVVKQKELVEQKNKDITDSINYARNIQEAVLVNIIEIKKCFNESFVLFRPRDIVSGDFYWFSHRGEFAYIAAADCTGHGVPGAFMSMLGMAFLNEIVNNNDYVTPNEILNSLRENVIYSLHQTGKAGESKDGMDLALAMVNLNNNDMQFSGANNPLYIIRKIENYNSIDFENSESRLQFLEADNAVLIEIKPDKMPIGYYIKDNLFSNNYMQLKPSDRIYLFSDGYADQFGGPKGKKFKYTQLKDIFLLTNNLNMDDQREFLDKTIIEWRGEHEQIDDILIVGISID